jgi:predicted MPP superfamily phosphohydrolase
LSISDPSSHKNLPGNTGNRFDTLIHAGNKINQLHPILIGIILLIMAILSTRFHWLFSLELFAFMLVDWLLIALLPTARKSYGPYKPTLLVLAFCRSLFAFLPAPISLIFQTVGTLLVFYSFWIEPQRLTLTRQTLVTNKLKLSRPLKVMHLGDLHIERLTAREQKLQEIIEETKPDLILFTGDILNLSYLKDPVAQETARQVISKWHAPLGVFIVSGSPAVDLPQEFPLLVKDLPVRWLQDEVVTIPFEEDEIELVGMSCTHDPQVDSIRLQRLVDHKDDQFRILLYHSPDMAPETARQAVDLQLSGHTHGGQVRLPFYGAIYTASLTGKRYESGRRQIGDLTLYVTRGIGMEGAAAPRVRFLCPPEVILWYISSSQGYPPFTQKR